jgi:hypothetical protein
VLRMLKNHGLPSRVIIIFDRITHLEVLEEFAKYEMFKNDRITVIAIARKENFDEWENADHRLSKIGFRKWYVPCLWQRMSDYMQRIQQVLLEPSSNVDQQKVEEFAIPFRKHLEYIGRGALGNVLQELKHPQYWSSDAQGDFYLQASLPHLINIQHDAWVQDVLNLNWSTILANLFAGIDMDEMEDRARIGTYHLLDWIAKKQIFTEAELMQAANSAAVTISSNTSVVNEIVKNLIRVLMQNYYLKREQNHAYRVAWDKTKPPTPRRVSQKSPSRQRQQQPSPLNIKSADAPDSSPKEARVGDQHEQSKPNTDGFEVSPSRKINETLISDLPALCKLLDNRFSADELKQLCFEIQNTNTDEFHGKVLEWENLSGDTKLTKIRELIEFLNRRNSLVVLQSVVNKHRPDIKLCITIIDEGA